MKPLFDFSTWKIPQAVASVVLGVALNSSAMAQKPVPPSNVNRAAQPALRLPTATIAGQLPTQSAGASSSANGANPSPSGRRPGATNQGNNSPSNKPHRPQQPNSSQPNHNRPRPHLPTFPQTGGATSVPPVVVTPVPNPTGPQPKNPRPDNRPVVTTNPVPPPNFPSPGNPLPPTQHDEPENKAPAKKIAHADRALTQRVHGEVDKLLDVKVDDFQKLAAASPLSADQLRKTGYDRKIDTLTRLLKEDAADEDVGRAAQALIDGRGALEAANMEGADGLGPWLDELEGAAKDAALLCGVQDAIADALADGGKGMGMAPGLFGPGWFAPGGGGAAGPVVPGPGGFAPGGGGPGPGFGGPGGFAPGGGGPGPGPGFGGPGGLAPPMGGGGGGGGVGGGGGAGGGAAFDININLNLWFGFGGCPVCCCPWLPVDCCWWIGPQVLVCGTGGYGSFGVMYCPPAYIGLPVPYVMPVPNALPYVNYAGRIVLLNPLETGATVNYVIASQLFSMDAGMMQDMELASAVIRFDHGGGFGEAAYTLTPASYKFVVTDHGWDLVKTSFQATFDNTANAGDFSLLLDGELVTIPAGTAQSLTSAYPIAVSFDNGMGQTVSKQLANGQTYSIGINVATSGWDLFPGDAAATGIGNPEDAYVVASAGEIAPPHPMTMP